MLDLVWERDLMVGESDHNAMHGAMLGTKVSLIRAYSRGSEQIVFSQY